MDEWMLAVAVLTLGLVLLAVNLFRLYQLNRDLNELERRLLEMQTHRNTGPPTPTKQGSRNHLHGHVARRPEQPPHGHQPRPAGK